MNTHSPLTQKDDNNRDEVRGFWNTYTPLPVEELKAKLTPKQFEVTQHEATETPFANEYTDNTSEGVYVDIISGEPLFLSIDKYDSGTGWPTFTRPINNGVVKETEDTSYGMYRTAVKSNLSGAHLGHVFQDSTKPTGLSYCMNSASMRFIPKEDLEKEGYGQFLHYF